MLFGLTKAKTVAKDVEVSIQESIRPRHWWMRVMPSGKAKQAEANAMGYS